MSVINGFTPTQSRMLAVLADGLRHSREELQKCLQDDLAPTSAVGFHLTYIRKKLQERGEDIVPIYDCRRCFHQWVRLISNDE